METKVYTSYAEIYHQKLALSVEKTIDNLTPGSLMQNVLGNVGSLATKYDWLSKIVVPLLNRLFMK